MSRLSILMRQPKSVLGVLTALVVAVGLTVASGADFTAQTANPSNTFSSGNLSMDNSNAGAAVFSPTNMKPGGTPDTGTVDIKNSGSISGTFSVTADTITNSDATNPMAAKVNLVVKDCGAYVGATAPTCEAGDNSVYTGTLAAFTAGNALGTFAAGEQHRYEFSAQLDSSANDDYEGDNTSARFVWNAVQ
jgi:spore coat-associated protein N